MYKSFARDGAKYDKEIILSDESMLNSPSNKISIIDMKDKMKKINMQTIETYGNYGSLINRKKATTRNSSLDKYVNQRSKTNSRPVTSEMF